MQAAQMSEIIDEKSPRLLIVDSLAPIELIVSFGSLSRWYEQKSIDPFEKTGKASRKNESLINDHDAISVAESKRIKFILNERNQIIFIYVFC